jgi:hypothetical protein
MTGAILAELPVAERPGFVPEEPEAEPYLDRQQVMELAGVTAPLSVTRNQAKDRLVHAFSRYSEVAAAGVAQQGRARLGLDFALE